MNNNPHIHTVIISQTANAWHITYGDQDAVVFKPDFFRALRSPGKLKRAVRKIIRKHDDASRKAPRTRNIMAMAIPNLDPNGGWGSDQIKRIKA